MEDSANSGDKKYHGGHRDIYHLSSMDQGMHRPGGLSGSSGLDLAGIFKRICLDVFPAFLHSDWLVPAATHHSPQHI